MYEDATGILKRGDPYASIGHYPEMHMDISELDHDHIDSDHEGHFGQEGLGSEYDWDPSSHIGNHGGVSGYGHHRIGHGGSYGNHILDL